MAVEQYSLVTGDWLGLGYIINDLATRVVGQIVAPGSSPEFAGATIDLLTMNAAIPTAIDIGGLYTGSQITLTGTSVTDHAIEIDGVYSAALIYTHTSSATADTLLWGDMASTAISGDFNGLRPRLTCNAASGGLNARAVYGEVIVGASKYAALTQGLLAHVSYAAGSCHITNIHALGVHISQGASLTATNLYGIIVTVQTRGDETISGNDYMMRLDNEAVGGNGRQMDAAIQIVNTNMSGGIKGYGYGIDFSGGTFATAEIRFSNGETISNLTDGQLNVTGDLVVSGTLTAGTLTDGTLLISSGSITSGVDATFSGTIQAEQLTSTDDINAIGNIYGISIVASAGVFSLDVLISGKYTWINNQSDYIQNDAAGAIQIYTANTERLEIDSAEATFTVPIATNGAITGASFTDGTLTITGGNISGADVDISAGTGSYSSSGTLGAGATTLDSLVVDSPTLVVNATSYEDRVGIGTATPGSPLHVAKEMSDHTPLVLLENLGTNSGEGDVLDVYTRRADGFTDGYIAQFRNIVGTKVYIRGDGNVGIGTTGPDELLEVAGASGASIRIDSAGHAYMKIDAGSNAYDSSVYYQVAGDSKWLVGLKSDDDYSIQYLDGTWQDFLHIQTDGNVGIGVIDPDAKLEVAGTLHVSGAATFDGTLSAGVATLAAVDTAEVYNSAGDLKIMPDVQGDVILFGDTDVGQTEDGKKLIIYRKAAAPDGNSNFQFYLDQHKTAIFVSNQAVKFQSVYSTLNFITGTDDSMYFTCGGYFYFRDKDDSSANRATLDSATGWLALGTPDAPTVALDVTGEAVINDKAKITSIGGYAVKLTNKTGGNTVAGQLVIASVGTTDAFATAGANAENVIGTTLDAGVADASEAWVVVSGIADVLIDAGGSTIGDRMIASATAGSADVWNVGGAVATHFLEIGHCIETRVGAGLARCVLHFN